MKDSSDKSTMDLFDFKACPVCSNPLPVHSAAGRPSVHCSNACKMKAYRQRSKTLRNSNNSLRPLRNSKEGSAGSASNTRTKVWNPTLFTAHGVK